MKWGTAKTLIIICLVILNIVLLLMIQSSGQRYFLTEERERTIIEVLEKNNIYINTALLKNFEPKKSLEMIPFSQSREEIRDMFLEDGNNARLTTEFEKTIYTLENKKLTISNSNILYENTVFEKNFELTEETAIKVAEEFLQRIDKSNFKFNLTAVRKDYILVDFREVFQEKILYGNYFQFKLSENGIIEIKCSYHSPANLYGYKQELIAPDEALLNFMQNIRKFYVETEVLAIERFDLVYYQNIGVIDRHSTIRLTPHYRIYLKDRVEPFLINAFSNEFIFSLL